ncbi:glycosyl hydrolase family 18 protein, partial [Sphaerospermopsis sp. FACHB-1194]|uniref:glycosyl hydrolase family 18 protein n=1 Tax=Sphaerospermopsis sp. FACHB-1194 TaxID=2692862 RepID=UPI0016813E69
MAESTKTVVFIDPNVADWQSLVDGVEPGSLVFILDPRRDGIRQITDKLAALTDVDSLQIISHGGEGSLSLGSTVLNSANLNGYSSQLQQWGQSLTTTGDILLYGCDVAGGVIGKAFVQQISQLTGADVAASDDWTGSAALGGDWLLEYATGLIEAPLALQVEAMEAYTAVLPNYVVGGYYTNWSTYERNFQVQDIPADKLTHVFYAFTKIENGEVALTDPWADIEQTFGGKYTWQQSQAGLAGNLAELKALKQNNPNLKTMMSVGGWTLSSPFSDAALTDSSRTKFATSAVQLMVKYGFDGLDIDWEYPVGGGEAGNINRPEDKQNYTLLLQTLRQELNKQQAIDGKQYQLTVASPASSSTMANFELAQISQYIDFFNLMAYDYHGSTFESTTNHNAPLYAGFGQQSIDSTIQGYLNAGVAAEDIVLGAPAYGYGWAGVPNIKNGLLQSSSGKASGTWATGVYDYKDLYNKLQTQPSVYTRYWDDIAKVPYIYSPTDQGGMFSSYEDSQSIGIKTNYIKDKGLGGMFFWDLSSDLVGNHNDSLVNNAYKYLTLGQNFGGSPTITLAVSPSSVLENGPNNLIYTFTRTGATTNSLTVNYSIAGTAGSSDYTGATPGTGKTITFAAGASTATLTIDPTGDSTPESDETVALTLASGTGYTIGTNTAVTGTITNDDVVLPTITLAVSPSSVLENGPNNLIYTFTRTGATTNSLTVNYSIAG